MAYIYKILNIVNGKIYIGSTSSIRKRWYAHKYALNKNKHINIHLQNAWKKYGENNFEFIVLEEVLDEEQYIIEQRYLDELKPFNTKGYNMANNAINSFENCRNKVCKVCKESFYTLSNNQSFCSEECDCEYETSSWRYSHYWSKRIENWSVDDHLAAYWDDMFEK